MIATWASLWLMGCGTPVETPEPKPVPVGTATPRPAPQPDILPTVTPAAPDREGKTASPIRLIEPLKVARGILAQLVYDHGRDPANPWAIGHAMLALGPDVVLTNDQPAVDWLFSEYAERVDVGGTFAVTFPAKRGSIRIEPHTDLVLKALSETGVDPTRQVTVQGQPHTIADLYRYSLLRAWVKGPKTNFQLGGYNDTPWALQGLATWAPKSSLEWAALGRRRMSLDSFTSSVVGDLTSETGFMAEAMKAGTVIPKDTRRGLFAYTCGGQHLLQGAAWAVGSGHGTEADRATICEQVKILDWRVDVELNALDPMLADPAFPSHTKTLLTVQRLKFLGHYLETAHKISALALCDIDVAMSDRVAIELVRTVSALDQLGVFVDPVGTVRDNTRLDADLGPGRALQTYLDVIGDSAHAVRGIDLATGAASIRY